MASVVGKVVENVKLGNYPSSHSALAWSQDDRISVVTDQCVYILTPRTLPQFSRTGIDTGIACIPRRKTQLVLDVGIDREQLLADKPLRCFLDPEVTNSLRSNSGFLFATWSPLNCDKNGRCLLATLSSDYQLSIHLSPTLVINWKEVIDISQTLANYLKSKKFKIDQDVMPAEDLVSTYSKHPRGVDKTVSNMDYALLKQRTAMLSFTCLHWFSQLYHGNGEVLPSEIGGRKSCKTEHFAVIATGCQSGHVFFWKVAVPVTCKNSANVALGGVLDTQLSLPCSLAWQATDDSKGLLAVGSMDGLVKVFSLKVLVGALSLPFISGVKKYILWGDRDELCAQHLDWLHEAQSGTRLLVVCKGAVVIIFSISVKDGLITQKPTHRLITGVHRMPITGLCCTKDQEIYTCSLDASVQKISPDDTTSRPVHFDGKPGFLHSGIGMSANGVYLALFQSPSNSTFQYLESHQVQILFVNFYCGPSIDHLLKVDNSQLHHKWDVLKALQHFIYQGNELTPRIRALCSSAESLESFSFAQLILKQHVLTLLPAVTQQGDEPAINGAASNTTRDWSTELSRTIQYVYMCLVSSTLKSWLKGRWDGTVDNSDSVLVLVMCDWLIKNFTDSTVLAIVSEVYKACNDTEGLRILSASRCDDKLIVGGASMNHDSSRGEVSDTIAHDEQLNRTEALHVPMDTSHGSPGSFDKDGNSCLRDESLKEIPRETEDVVVESRTNNKQSRDSFDLPARERCPICESPVPVESLEYGCCLSGHKWQRCSVASTVCSDLIYKRCQDCRRCVSFPRDGMSPWLHGHLNRTTRCPICWGWFI